MWTWITHLCRRNRTEPTRSAIAMATLIELNMLELNAAEARNRVELDPPGHEAALLERFKASAQLILNEKPPSDAADSTWESLGQKARRLNRGFADLRLQLSPPAIVGGATERHDNTRPVL